MLRARPPGRDRFQFRWTYVSTCWSKPAANGALCLGYGHLAGCSAGRARAKKSMSSWSARSCSSSRAQCEAPGRRSTRSRPAPLSHSRRWYRPRLCSLSPPWGCVRLDRNAFTVSCHHPVCAIPVGPVMPCSLRAAQPFTAQGQRRCRTIAAEVHRLYPAQLRSWELG